MEYLKQAQKQHLKQKEHPFTANQTEISPESGKDLEKLENWLTAFMEKDSAEQCVFVLRSLADKNFRNQCKDAVKAFGRGLAEKFGGEESFFELAPHAAFSVARINSSPPKMNYRVDFHDVGILEFKKPNEKPFSLIFDLTHGTVAGDNDKDKVLIMHVPGAEKQTLEALKKYYGGSWRIEFDFDAKTGNFVYRYH